MSRNAFDPTSEYASSPHGVYPHSGYPHGGYPRSAFAADESVYPPQQYSPSGYPPDDAPPPRNADRRSFLGQLGPVGIAAIFAVVLVIFGTGAVVISVLRGSPQPAAQAPADGPTAVDSPTDPPPPTPEASSSASAKPSQSAGRVAGDPRQEFAVVALVNNAREQVGCRRPVRMDDRLQSAARGHSVDMATRGFFSHTGSDGSSPEQRMRRAGFNQPGAENIARGQRSAREVVQSWLDSPPHRRNMLDCDVRDIGVGLAVRNGNDPYWTQNLGR